MRAMAARPNYAPITSETLNYSGVSGASSPAVSNEAWSRLTQRGEGSGIMETSYPSSAGSPRSIEGAWRSLTNRASGRPLMDTSFRISQPCPCPPEMSPGEPRWNALSARAANVSQRLDNTSFQYSQNSPISTPTSITPPPQVSPLGARWQEMITERPPQENLNDALIQYEPDISLNDALDESTWTRQTEDLNESLTHDGIDLNQALMELDECDCNERE